MVRVAFIKGYGMKREGYFRHPAKGRSDELFVVHVIIVTIRNSTCCSACEYQRDTEADYGGGTAACWARMVRSTASLAMQGPRHDLGK